MEKEIAIELIKLDVLDRTSAEETEALQFYRNDKDFPSESLGNYQNLISIIAATAGLTNPPIELKQKIFSKLYKLRTHNEKYDHEKAIKELEEEIKQSQNIDVHLEDQTELVEVETEIINHHESRKKPSIEELKLSKGGIKLKDPNFSNIHLIMEDRKSKIPREKEISDIQTDSNKIEVVAKTPTERTEKEDKITEESKVEIKTKRETRIELTKIDRRSLRKRRLSTAARGTFRERDRSKVLIAAAAFLIIAAIVYLIIPDSQSNPVEIAESKPLSQKTVVEPIEVKSESAEVEVGRQEVQLKSDPINEQKVVEDITPALPEPPKIIETPLDELEDTQHNIVDVNIKEKSVEIPVTAPLEIKKVEIESPYFVAVEEMPEPIGGITAIQNKIVYPEIARRAGVEGKVFVLAYVDETGTVTKTEITKGIGSGCDEAAMDAVLKTKFRPGVQRGKPVKVKITIPIVFKR